MCFQEHCSVDADHSVNSDAAAESIECNADSVDQHHHGRSSSSEVWPSLIFYCSLLLTFLVIHSRLSFSRSLRVLKETLIASFLEKIFGPARRVPKSHSSCCSCSCSWNQFCKNLQCFLNTQRSATKLCICIRAHIPYRSTVSGFKIKF